MNAPPSLSSSSAGPRSGTAWVAGGLVAFVMVTLLAVAVGLWQLRLDTLAAQQRSLATLTIAISDELERGLRGVQDALLAVAQQIGEGRLVLGDPHATVALRDWTRLQALADRLWVLDARGGVIATSLAAPPPPLSTLHRFEASQPTPAVLALSAPFIDAADGSTRVALALQLPATGAQDAAWIVAGIPAAELQGAFTKARPATDARLLVRRRDGAALAGTLAHAATAPDIAAALPAAGLWHAPDGSHRLVEVHALQAFPLDVMMTRDLAVALTRWRELVEISAAVAVAVLAAVAALLAGLWRAESARARAQRALRAHEQEREAQARHFEARLARSRKLESLGTLAGGVAHDFNNILATLLGYAEMAAQAAPPGSAQARHLDQVLESGQRGRAMVRRLMAFGGSGAQPREPVAVQPVIDEVLELLSVTMDPRIQVERPGPVASPVILGDGTRLFEAVLNLCTNALQSMPEGGTLSVSATRHDVALREGLSHGELAAGAYVALSVADTGLGIRADVMERLFEPFFTTRGRSGMGLGLAVVHGVVVDFDGAIDVRSRPGSGSRFTLYFPLAEGATAPPGTAVAAVAAATPPPARVEPAAPARGRTVMVVDDELPLVRLAEEVLGGLGYRAAGFTDPQAAWSAFTADPNRYDVLVTDEAMPGQSGIELAWRVHAVRADLPVLLVSGHGGPHLQQRAQAAGITQVLIKPLHNQELADAVAAALLAFPSST